MTAAAMRGGVSESRCCQCSDLIMLIVGICIVRMRNWRLRYSGISKVNVIIEWYVIEGLRERR